MHLGIILLDICCSQYCWKAGLQSGSQCISDCQASCCQLYVHPCSKHSWRRSLHQSPYMFQFFRDYYQSSHQISPLATDILMYRSTVHFCKQIQTINLFEFESLFASSLHNYSWLPEKTGHFPFWALTCQVMSQTTSQLFTLYCYTLSYYTWLTKEESFYCYYTGYRQANWLGKLEKKTTSLHPLPKILLTNSERLVPLTVVLVLADLHWLQSIINKVSRGNP